MIKNKVLLFLMSFLMVLCINNIGFALAKKAEEEIKPVWMHLQDQVLPSGHNPSGTKVIYGMDVASIRFHKSKANRGDFGFWLAEIVKAQNEIVLTWVQIAKDKSYYKEKERKVFYLDGTLKSAEELDVQRRIPMNGSEPFYYAPDVYKEKAKATVSDMEMPELPDGFNKMLLKDNKVGFEDWLCFLDNRASGVDADESNKLVLVTYAYNPDDRVYYKGKVYCQRTGPTSYEKVGGEFELCTYEDKLLSRKETQQACFVSDKDAESAVRDKYMFYREEKK
ncbi:MAG: hypothetical protein SOV56_01440 [Phascolarctobacterium sp.]|nr:hypothetical protein [Phascolarctobacterium sp.]